MASWSRRRGTALPFKVWATQRPSRHRIFSRRPRRRGGPPPGWRNSTRQKASVALRMIRRLKNEVEVKSCTGDVNLTCNAAGSLWVFQHLNAVAQGDTELTRDGNKTMMKSLSTNLLIESTGAETGFLIRVIIFYDRKPAGALPTAATLFLDDQPHTIYNWQGNSKGRYQIIYDRMMVVVGPNRVGALKIFLPINKKTDYDLSNLGTIADISRGSLFIACSCEGNANNVDIDGSYRLKFTDR